LEPQGLAITHKDFSWLKDGHWARAARAYNQAISKRALAGCSFLKTHLSEKCASDERQVDNWIKEAVKSAKDCFDELCSAIQEYVPRYGDTEFPFAPDSRTRPLADGRVEKRRDNVFILTVDIINGTDAEQTNEMKEEVRATFRHFEKSGLLYEDTGNDAFIAIADDSLVLWDVAKSLMLKGQSLRSNGGPFGGTRKGLYFGSVSVVEQQNGERVFRDARVPHDIPRAFCILDGIEKHLEANRRNDFLVIEKSTLELCNGRIGIVPSQLSQCLVEGKHVTAPCFLAELS
jgi:hypothetical protein